MLQQRTYNFALPSLCLVCCFCVVHAALGKRWDGNGKENKLQPVNATREDGKFRRFLNFRPSWVRKETNWRRRTAAAGQLAHGTGNLSGQPTRALLACRSLADKHGELHGGSCMGAARGQHQGRHRLSRFPGQSGGDASLPALYVRDLTGDFTHDMHSRGSTAPAGAPRAPDSWPRSFGTKPTPRQGMTVPSPRAGLSRARALLSTGSLPCLARGSERVPP